MGHNYEGEERREARWHLEKTVSIGHIITTVAIAGSVLAWAMRMDSRMVVVETQITFAAHDRGKLESNYRESVQEIKAGIVRIENKLDHKADK